MASEFFITSYSKTYSEIGLAQSKMWQPNTLCMTIAGENTAETAILSFPACFPDSVVGFIADPEKADVRFVKYYLDTIKRQIKKVTRGATQDNLSLDKLLSFDIFTPPLSEQHKISSILAAYDELILNNTRRIAILETMAQSIHREWFVELRFPGYEKVKIVDSPLGKIPQGWEYKPLAKLADVNALSVKKGQEPEEINYVDIASVSTGSIEEVRSLPFSEAPGRARRIVRHGDIIWSTVRPNRKSYSLILNPLSHMIVSTGFAVISGSKAPFTYLYHVLTTDDFVGYLVNHATGSAYPAVNSSDFEKAEFLVPSEELLTQFHQITNEMFLLKNRLHEKNRSLRASRDLLLPRLISGQLNVEHLDIDTGESSMEGAP
jgi:type I restriction enzyme S subunit